MRDRLNALLIVVMAVVIGVLRPTACAQAPLAIDFDSAFSPDFMRSDAPTFRTMLALDADQTVIIEALLRDYGERFEASLRMVREDLREAQSAMGLEDPAVGQEREMLRAEIAVLLEEMQEALENVPPGADAGQIAIKYERHIRDLQARLAQLQSRRVEGAALARVFDDAAARLERWRDEKRVLREQFVGDVLAVSHDQQHALWPALDRRLLRERTLRRGLLQGESVDLTLVVRDLRLSEGDRQMIAPRVEEYELALDQALRARNAAMESSERTMVRAILAGDRAAMTTAMARIMQLRTAVRNANDDAAVAIAAALGDQGPAFMRAYRQRAYPQAVRDTQAMRLIKAAQQMPDLPPAHKQAVDAMRVQYETEIAAMDDQVIAAVRQHEPTVMTEREVMRLLLPVDEAEDEADARGPDAVQQAYERRNELSRRYDAQLLALLGEDLYERLPRNTRAIEPQAVPPANTRGDAANSDNRP